MRRQRQWQWHLVGGWRTGSGDRGLLADTVGLPLLTRETAYAVGLKARREAGYIQAAEAHWWNYEPHNEENANSEMLIVHYEPHGAHS